MTERKRTSISIDGSIPDVYRDLGVKNFSRRVEKLCKDDIKSLRGVSDVVESDLDKVGEKLKVLSDRWSKLWAVREGGAVDGKENN